MNRVFKIGFLVIVLLAIPAGVYLVSKAGSAGYRAKAGKHEEVFVFIMPAQVEIERGERIDLMVKIDTGRETVGGVKLLIDFDPLLLSFSGTASPGSAFPELTSQSRPGQIELDGQGELVGQGTVAILNFQGVRRGETMINVSGDSLVWDEGKMTNILGKTAEAKVIIE